MTHGDLRDFDERLGFRFFGLPDSRPGDLLFLFERSLGLRPGRSPTAPCLIPVVFAHPGGNAVFIHLDDADFALGVFHGIGGVRGVNHDVEPKFTPH